MGLYLGFMYEASNRLAVVNRACTEDTGFPIPVMRELCYLQFRFVCELIALCCLVAHGNTDKRLMQTYQADKIMNQMERLKPTFYPYPTKITKENGKLRFTPQKLPLYLTKKHLIKLWGITGDKTHRSPLSKAMRSDIRDPEGFADILEWGEKFAALLPVHQITLDPLRVMVVTLFGERTGQPEARILKYSPETNMASVQVFWRKRIQ